MTQNIIYYLIGVFVFAFALSYYLYPKISDIIHFKKLMDSTNDRSSHLVATPNLGGIAFFISLFLSFYFIDEFDDNNFIMAIIPGLIILFVVGLKDDLVILSPLSKLCAQIASALFLIFHKSFSVDSLHGFMGIENIPFLLSSTVEVLIIVTIINAINLLDGIDGLASIIGVITLSLFGSLFFSLEIYLLTLICAVMTGSLLAFLRFNLSSKRKIFMGDTGSMLLGFIIAFMTIRVFALDAELLETLPFQTQNMPYVLSAILIIPLFDTVRVFTVRILKKKSPFLADRSHIHHLILDYYKITHKRASLIIGLVNFLVVLLFSFLAINTTQRVLLVFFIALILAATIFFFVLNRPRIIRKIKYLWYKKTNLKL
jgi:UDP-N-acetylmuramyl pentapeptide phosphotransferase/UDP-N-acetylglucosamine-1-phosphate transferase